LKRKSERLKVVLELAERNERAAMDVLSNKRRYRDDQQAQLDSLKSYHGQYVQDMKANMTGVQDISRLQANLHFMNQVDLAINQQEGVLNVAQQEFDHTLKIWAQLHQKKKGMADLITRYQNEEIQLLEKKAQKQIEDDLLARRYRR